MSDIQITPRRKLTGKVATVLKAAGRDFVSQPVDELELTYEGIAGDHHAGLTRSSGAREPWYGRGTQMRNERQLSILSVEELADIADNMGLIRVEPGWIGANLVLEGIPRLTYLPPRTLLMFAGGATIRVDGDNGPCRIAGASIAAHVGAPAGEAASDFDPGRSDLALRFVEAAHRKRGLVGWVEREGTVKPGEPVTVRLWEQWIYE